MMTPGGGDQERGQVGQAIDSTFGSFENFQQAFAAAAMGQFGSGWAWLVADGGKLAVMSTPNQDTPVSQGRLRCWSRRLGARLLSEISESAGRLREGLVECGQLALRQ